MARKDLQDIYPLSPAQRGMLFESLSAAGSGVHIEQLGCRLTGELDAAAFRLAWQRLVERHPMLRTAFLWKEQEEPLQAVMRHAELPVEERDWRGLPSDEQERRMADYLAADRRSGFALAKPPLLRLALFQIADDVHRVVWTHHHILMDGWCGPLLLRESLALYRSLLDGDLDGDGLELPAVRPYGDFIDWLRTRDLAAAEAFWRRTLLGLTRPTALGRETEEPSAGEPAERFGEVSRALGGSATAALQALARELRLTLNTLVQGAWALLLGRYSGGEDVVFGITLSGRPAELEGIEGTVGLFINTLPVRMRVDPAMGLGEWLQALQALNLEVREHGHAPAGELRRWCAMPAHLPLFESTLVYENFPADGLSAQLADSPLRIGDVQGEGARTGFAVTLLAAAAPGLAFKLVHDRTRVESAGAAAMLAHLERVLERCAAGPDQPLAAVQDVVPEAEIPQVRSRRAGAARRAGKPFVPPRTLAEEVVAGIWSQVLGLSEIGVEDDFFELGGHSLVASEAVGRLREAFRLDLRLRHLFGAPTVAVLAAEIARLRGQDGEGGAPEMPALVPDPEHRFEPFPLNDIQQAYWVGRGESFELGNVSTYIYTELDSEGLDLARLERAWQRLVERHEMLRAVVLPDGRQRILPRVPPYEIPVSDLSGIAVEEREAVLAELRERMSHQVLPSDRWPLFDLRASRLGPDRVRLHLGFDLLVADGWSWGILFRDLAWIYLGQDAALPALELSFRDYVLAERQLEASALYQRCRQYWLDRLPGLPPAPELPLAGNPAQLQRPRFVRRESRLDAAGWQRLKERASRLALTPSTLLLAAFAEVLALWSKSPRFTVNLTLFHRLPLHPQVQEIVGDFTSLTLLEIDCAAAGSFAERARRLQDRLWDDLDHRSFSGIRVLRELARRAGGPARAAMPVVFTSTLNLSSPARSAAPSGSAGSGLRLSSVYSIGQTPQVLLDHQVQEEDGALAFNWDAVDEAFAPGVLDDMFAAYRTLLARLADEAMDFEQAARGLLPARQLDLWRVINGKSGPVPEGLLHAGFEARAAERPEALAVLAADRVLTYGELERRSRALAHALRAAGVCPNRLVAVVMEKGWEEIVAVLAVLRAGAAYLPIDAALPSERVLDLLAQGEVEVALIQPAVEPRLAWPAGLRRIAVVEEETDAGTPLPPASQPATDLAYVIFTSGSTGRPKGVMIDHRGALNTVADINRRFAVGPTDRAFALSSLSFDLSVYDIFGLLAAGGAVVLPAVSALREPAEWLDLCLRHGITLWSSVPALLEMLVESGKDGARLPALRLCLLSGDWIPLGLPDRLRALAPGCQVVSLGGATEASIWSVAFPVGEVAPSWPSIPYGRPLTNQRMLVLDHMLAPRPEWVVGALFIGGVGVARGYWRDSERTTAAFLESPESGERLYRTGDLARLAGDGNLELLGREDLQVKVRGHRIELGEIEAALEQHPAVSAAVVAAVGEDRAHRRLVAYVVTSHDARAAAADALADRIAYLDLKLGEAGLRRGQAGQDEIELPAPGPEVEPLWAGRRSERHFTTEPVPWTDLALLLSCLRQLRLPGSPLPKHRYPSAGSLYPVQVYLHVRPGRVEGLCAGGYYYDPKRHGLVLLSPEGRLDRELHGPVNRPIFDGSAFSIFLVGRLDAIAPAYGERARDFCLIEAGAMCQLLMTVAPDHGLGLCPIGSLEREEPLAELFALEDGHAVLHSLLGGHPAPAALRQANSAPATFADALRSHLGHKLPAYMVPSSFVFLDALPLNANGKVDRRALPRPEQGDGRERPPFTAPRSPLEERLAAILSEVLGVERVGVYDNFLELGGDSVKAIQVLTRAREAGIELTVREMFDHQTVAGLAETARQGTAGEAQTEPEPPAPFSMAALSLEELEDMRRELGDERESDTPGDG